MLFIFQDVKNLESKVARLAEADKENKAEIENLKSAVEQRDNELNKVSRELAEKEEEVYDLSEKLETANHANSPASLSRGKNHPHINIKLCFESIFVSWNSTGQQS